MRLANKVVFISGAGSGMGRVAAQMFAREGASIIANDYNAVGLNETAELVRTQGGEIAATVGDVSTDEDVRRCIQEGVQRFGKLDVLYNNAGVALSGDASVLTMSDNIWAQTLAINTKGIALCCKHGIPELQKVAGGSISYIASFVA